MSQEDPGSAEQSGMGPAYMAGVAERFTELRQNLQGSSGSGKEEASNEDMSDEMSIDMLTNHQLGLSHKVFTLSSESSGVEDLMRHAKSWHDQFMSSRDIKKLDKAIGCWRRVALGVSNPEARRAAALSNLGYAYCSRFERLGKLVDLNEVIKCGEQAVLLTPDGHADKPAYIDDLGVSYQIRFKQVGEIVDLNRAVECGTQAVSLTPDGSPGKLGALNNLGITYQARFERFGEATDLNEAIECGVQAVSLTPENHADRPNILNNLGVSYRTRFERIGEVGDLNIAIDCGEQAVSLTPNGHADKPSRFNNLGISYQIRFQRHGGVADLNGAITCGERAVSLTSDGHTAKPMYFNNLGNSYRTRFEGYGNIEDVNKAIECGVQAVSLTPNGDPRKPMRLSNLGSSYLARFIRLGAVDDLNEAVGCGVQARSLTPDNHADKPNILNDLGMSYRTRFQRLGEVADLNKAIECGTQAVELTPGDNAVKPSRLSNLGNSYLTRFGELREEADVNGAIQCGEEAVSLTPDGHAHKPKYLNNLGNSYQTRFGQLGRFAKVEDLDQAIEYGARAVSLTPDGHPDKPGHLNNLGISYQTRFQRCGELADVNKAIECGLQAVSLTPNGHAARAMYLTNLGNSYHFQFSQSQLPSDLEPVISAYRRAAQSSQGSPSIRLQACLLWARSASYHATFSPCPAYLQAVDLLPQTVWIGNTLDRRYRLIKKLGDFAPEAAAFAIGIGNLELALEWLEACRSIVWGQAAQLRTPFDLLATKNPDLAKRLKEVGSQLELAGSHSSVTSFSEARDTDPNVVARGHIQLALEWERLLKQARSIPGFEDFLQPTKSSLLLHTAKSHPIVVINAHESRCDALILQPNCSSISHVPLTDLSVTSASNMRMCLVSQRGQRRPYHVKSVGPLKKSLHDLWSSVLHPILDFLGYTPKLSIEELPRLTWCTTGLLSFLPLHAAGCYDETHLNAMNMVISTYTPTLNALLAQKSAIPDTRHGILAVGQEHTPGLPSLPGTKAELAVIAKHAQRNCYLQLENNEATTEQVLDAMDQFGWVHMACHGRQDPDDPTQSAFYLHGGNLTLADITKKSFTNKGFAFLSACQTATGDKTLPEEAVHLAAGMLMAGFPSVIGTMWSIIDEDGPKIANKVYASLLKDGKMDHTNAARALHEAVVELRETVGEMSFERWAPFIHIGC